MPEKPGAPSKLCDFVPKTAPNPSYSRFHLFGRNFLFLTFQIRETFPCAEASVKSRPG
jgi:hypothetical protein